MTAMVIAGQVCGRCNVDCLPLGRSVFVLSYGAEVVVWYWRCPACGETVPEVEED